MIAPVNPLVDNFENCLTGALLLEGPDRIQLHHGSDHIDIRCSS